MNNKVMSWLFVASLLIVAWSVILVFQFFDTVRPYFWKETTGTVLRTSAEEVLYIRGETKEVKWEPRIVYEYEVNDDLYQSYKLTSQSLRFKQKQDAIRYLDNYPEGSPINIFINPDDPKSAILIRNIQIGKGLIAILGILVFAYIWKRFLLPYILAKPRPEDKVRKLNAISRRN